MATTIPTELKTSEIVEKWASEIKTAYTGQIWNCG